MGRRIKRAKMTARQADLAFLEQCRTAPLDVLLTMQRRAPRANDWKRIAIDRAIVRKIRAYMPNEKKSCASS